MEFTRMLLWGALAFILFADVIVSMPTSGQDGELTAMVRDIDERIISDQRHRHRRRRRNVMTQNIAIMEYCLQHPNSCRREIERLRNAQRRGNRPQPLVIVIEK